MSIAFPCGVARLSVVRHGESTANVLFADAERRGDAHVRVPEGRDADVGLSGRGVAQGRELGRWLVGLAEGERPEVVVCSPYVRAVATWDEMARVARESEVPCPPALTDERLRDREAGVLELLPPPAVRERFPEEAERRERVGDWFHRPPGGESLADVTLRVRDFLRDLGDPRSGAAGRHVLLVAHDAVVLAVRQALGGIGGPPPDLDPVPNASLSRWDGDGTHLRLTSYGDTSHLPTDA